MADAAARGYLEHGSSAVSTRVAAAEMAVANAAAEHAANGRAKPAYSSPWTAGDGAQTVGLYTLALGLVPALTRQGGAVWCQRVWRSPLPSTNPLNSGAAQHLLGLSLAVIKRPVLIFART